jgi:hypothetical protein
MAKTELFNNPLIPMVLVAGVLSGSLWRAAPPAENSKTGDLGSSSGDKSDGASLPAPWVSDLRPVLETLDGALGASVGSAHASPLTGATAVALAAEAGARDQQILSAMAGMRTVLDRLASSAEPTTCDDDAILQRDADVLGASMLADDGGESKTRAAEARALLDEFRDWRLLVDLATKVKSSRESTDGPTYSVDFIVATIPDYVDSNSGWIADQDLAAIQSGMAQENYLFDRVRLVDWSRASAGPAAVLSASRLHERQPGAIIFRKVKETDPPPEQKDEADIRLQVVLTVLETPTAGVHQVALRNSLWFLRAWNARSGVAKPQLRVLGPNFSGSTVSLAAVLREPAFRTSFTHPIVITGSATADDNVKKMATFSPDAIFRATVQPTWVLKARMAAYLASINPRWKDGNGVALLTESNTAYGRDANRDATNDANKDATKDANKSQEDKGAVGASADAAFAAAKVFYFPLHIAQLRNDAPPLSQPGTALLSGPVIPLNLREVTPPSDVIPALHPQLTGPIVEATVDSILDTIRHEKISAIGIIATDERDVLFLAREVKRASPDVQLFLFGAHGLYLHPDYVPYLRGALVASSYALALANQPEIAGEGLNARQRQAFPSMPAEGIFYAVRALLSLPDTGGPDETSPRYCPASSVKNCVPIAPASISVIGEDGYWTLPDTGDVLPPPPWSVRSISPPSIAISAPATLHVAPLPPIPPQFLIGAVLLLVIVAVHLWVMIRINRSLGDPKRDRAFFESTLVRVLVPPQACDRAAVTLHRFALTVCFALLSIAAAWVVAVILPFLLPEWAGWLLPIAFAAWMAAGTVPFFRPDSLGWLVPFAATATWLGVIYTGAKCYGPRRTPHRGLIATARAWLESLRHVLPVVWRAILNANAWFKSLPQVMAMVRAVIRTLKHLTMTERTGWLLFGGMVVTMSLFMIFVVQTALNATMGAPGRLTLARIVGGGIISPAALTVSLAAAFYTAIFTGVRRLSLIGFGYKRLADGSPAFALFTGERDLPVGETKQSRLAGMLDMPAQNMPPIYPSALLLVLLMTVISTTRVTTIEGRTFSLFVMVGTWTTLGLGLLQLAQGLALWSTARAHLKRLAQTPIEKHLEAIAPHVPWNISLVPPRLTELMPVACMGDRVMSDFRRLAFAGRYGAVGSELRRGLGDTRGFAVDEFRVGVRQGDLEALEPLCVKPSHVSALEDEMKNRQYAAIMQSETWLGLWSLSDSLVTMLQKTAWRRCTTTVAIAAVRREATVGGGAPGSGARPTATVLSGHTPEGHGDTPDEDGSTAGPSDRWFARCEQLVALEMAFVARDIVARTITCLFAAMLCLTLLTAAHLLYVFSGRASLLTVDMLAVGATALSAIWILVDMERDHVLSRLRTTMPGRVDINWEFIKRIGVYGVLPLLAVIAALFPEVGGTLFGWLEPLRKLSSF